MYLPDELEILSQNMKYGMPLGEFRPHKVVYRPIQCFFEPSVLYFNKFYVN